MVGETEYRIQEDKTGDYFGRKRPMKNTIITKILGVLLSAALVFTMMPQIAFAVPENNEPAEAVMEDDASQDEGEVTDADLEQPAEENPEEPEAQEQEYEEVTQEEESADATQEQSPAFSQTERSTALGSPLRRSRESSRRMRFFRQRRSRRRNRRKSTPLLKRRWTKTGI